MHLGKALREGFHDVEKFVESDRAEVLVTQVEGLLELLATHSGNPLLKEGAAALRELSAVIEAVEAGAPSDPPDSVPSGAQ